MRWLTLTLVGAVLVVGCSDDVSKRTLSGTLDVPWSGTSGSRVVVAMSTSGHVFHAPIASDGRFRIALPVGATYMLRFANATSSPQMYHAFAVLASARPAGTTHWITLTRGAPIALGHVGGPTAVAGVRDDDAAKSEADAEPDDGVEDDGAETCTGGALPDVESEHDALDDVDSDDDGVADSSDTEDGRPACTSATSDGGDCSLSDDQERDDESEHDGSCGPGAGGIGSGGTAGAPGGSGGAGGGPPV
jgi:hypothetical protein